MGDDLSTRVGGCLCGSVRYTADVGTAVLQCHCENCRRLSGNFVAASRCATDMLDIESPDDALGWHDLGYAQYGFCRDCGSTLFFRATETPDITSVMVGTLDDAEGLTIESVWFADEAQAHNTLPDGVAHHVGNG